VNHWLRICKLKFRLLWGWLRGMELVFQYGSNCSAGRLNGPDRLNGAASVVGTAETVEDYSLVFDVWSDGNQCAASDIVRTPGHKVWGVVYEIPRDFVFGRRADKRKTLEQIEGTKYQPVRIRLRQEDGAEHEALTFVVRENDKQQELLTSIEYLGYIVRGLREQGVSEDYIVTVKQIAVASNPAIREAAQQL
jgi:cation transport regulator ChaC